MFYMKGWRTPGYVPLLWHDTQEEGEKYADQQHPRAGGVLDGEEYLGISKDSSQKQRQVYTVHQSLMCQLARKGYKEDDRRR